MIKKNKIKKKISSESKDQSGPNIPNKKREENSFREVNDDKDDIPDI